MKQLLMCLMLLAFLISNGQESQYWKGKVPKDDSILIENTNKALKEMKPSYITAAGTLNNLPKYDTVRVLIAYADTTKASYPVYRFDTTNRVTVYSRLQYYPIETRIHWSFVYSVREISYGCGCQIQRGDYIYFEDDKKRLTHIKYITEEKKDIPKSWVVLIEKTF